MCLLWSVLRCQVFVAEAPTVFNVEPNTNNDMQMSLHLLVVLAAPSRVLSGTN